MVPRATKSWILTSSSLFLSPRWHQSLFLLQKKKIPSLNKNSIMRWKLPEKPCTEAAGRCQAVEQTPALSSKAQGNKWPRVLGTGSPASPRLGNQEFQYPSLWHCTCSTGGSSCLQMSAQKLRVQSHWNDRRSPEQEEKRGFTHSPPERLPQMFI